MSKKLYSKMNIRIQQVSMEVANSRNGERNKRVAHMISDQSQEQFRAPSLPTRYASNELRELRVWLFCQLAACYSIRWYLINVFVLHSLFPGIVLYPSLSFIFPLITFSLTIFYRFLFLAHSLSFYFDSLFLSRLYSPFPINATLGVGKSNL